MTSAMNSVSAMGIVGMAVAATFIQIEEGSYVP